jgi:acyl-CoA reductase-like NAD-dependent aldehyde dehydrogenase
MATLYNTSHLGRVEAVLTASDKLYIGGSWVEGRGEDQLLVVNPATEEEIAQVPQATTADVLDAIRRARTAFDDGPWPRMSPKERSTVLLRFADAAERRLPQIVELVIREAGCSRQLTESIQVGVPLLHFRDVVDRVLTSFTFEEPLLPFLGRGIGQGVVLREPLGVAALITPFNAPFMVNLGKLGPALAAGCTTVLKPSPYTPLQGLLLGELADEAGLPPGVLNIVTGDVDAGRELTTNPMVDIVSFTGSDIVGSTVYSQAAEGLKKVVLELGGKSANIIFPGGNLSKIVECVVMNLVTFAGQGCALLTRTLVHESIHDELVAAVTATLDRVKVGDPSAPETVMGPLIREAQRERVEKLIRDGVEEGADLAYGGGRPSGLDKGFYLEPTLFTGVDNSMTIAQREFFGPVGVVIPFRDEEEAVTIANDSDFGLGGAVWSPDPVHAYGVAKRIRTGTVAINQGFDLSPYGAFGGYKRSGLGREFGPYGLSEFLEYKTVSWSAASG